MDTYFGVYSFSVKKININNFWLYAHIYFEIQIQISCVLWWIYLHTYEDICKSNIYICCFFIPFILLFSHQFAIMNISLNFYTHMYISLMTGMISLFDVYGFTYNIPQKYYLNHFSSIFLLPIHFLFIYFSCGLQTYS